MIHQSLRSHILAAQASQSLVAELSRKERVALLEAYAAGLSAARTTLAQTLAQDAKKTLKDAQAEVDASIDILHKTIKDTALADIGDLAREKIRTPVGIVGLITSFNFPMVVAHWNIAPAILAGNVVLWKPSEKTPLAAFECKKIFDETAGKYKDALQLLKGNRALGASMVANEEVDMISATGGVAMGDAIRKTLATKENNSVPPILELGGNNAVVIGEKVDDIHISFALNAILSSFLGTTGQRCTNTRRLIVYVKWFERVVAQLERMVGEFISSGAIKDPENIYGYNQLIDDDAVKRLEHTKAQAIKQGARILFGGDNEPVLAIMPGQAAIMNTETFAPLLYLVPYSGSIDSAMELVNEPENAGLVNGIYTLSQEEADRFVALNEAGHSVINSPKGTGTPANGMGFGGNKASGSGEILWSADPLAAFTKPASVKRVVVNKAIPLS